MHAAIHQANNTLIVVDTPSRIWEAEELRDIETRPSETDYMRLRSLDVERLHGDDTLYSALEIRPVPSPRGHEMLHHSCLSRISSFLFILLRVLQDAPGQDTTLRKNQINLPHQMLKTVPKFDHAGRGKCLDPEKSIARRAGNQARVHKFHECVISREKHETEGLGHIGIQTNGAVANWLIQDERVLTSKGCTAMMHRAVYERLRSWTTLNRDRRSLNGQRPDYEAPGNLGQEVLRPR
ncbi:hypothetical protein K438DRAFT_1766286 [Mycena galopus ATCC 62051]|nr:hypothetical protein K438DRAFT_1766286 [Mycena galopus ATCC 62051]